MKGDPLEALIDEVVFAAEDGSIEEFQKTYAERTLSNQIPLYILLEAGDRLIRKNHTEIVACLVEWSRELGDDHPLLDEFESKFLWALGERNDALALAQQAAKRWDRDYLDDLVEVMKDLQDENF